MAIFHLHTKLVSRSEGRSAIACASYRAGEELHDERLGKSFKFKREERVAHTEIIAPAFAPEWVGDRAKLWNSVEAAERRKDAQVAREIIVALPNELPIRLQKQILRDWAQENLVSHGLVADIAVHKTPFGEPDQDHAHIMVSTRTLLEDGSWNKKKVRLETKTEQKEQLVQWRASWAKHCNAALEEAGYAHHAIDHRSNEDRGLPTIPTIKEGYAAQGIEARGDRSWRASINREIHRQNRQILAEIKARVTQATNAAKRAAAAIADGFQQLGRGPGETAPKSKPKPAPPPVWQPPPMRRPDKIEEEPFPVVDDVEAEKRKKAAHEAAWRQQGGGGGVGG